MVTPVLADDAVGAMECVETNATIKGEQLPPYMFHYWDPAGAIETPGLNAGFELSDTAKGFPFARLINPGEEVILGENKSNHWLRFCLRNTSNETQSMVIALEPPTMAEIDFYPQKPGLPSFKTGNTKKMSSRDIPNPQFDFNVRLAPGEEQTFYIRANAATTAFLLAKLWDRSSFYANNNITEAGFGIFMGVLMGLILYNALLFVSVRQSTSLLYIATSLSVLILLSSIDGRLVQYLTPEHPQVGRVATIVFYPFSMFLVALFCQEFLKLKDYPKLNRVGELLLLVSLPALLTGYFYDLATYFQVCAVFALLVIGYFGLLVPVYTLIKDRLFSAQYMLIAQSPFIVAIVDQVLFVLGITTQYYVPYTTKTALVVAMIIISYYISLVVHKEKDAAQRLAFEQLNVSNTLKNNYNQQLEEELEQKTTDIRSMNSNLEKQALQLLQLDESKSKFFANISHEFRTPLTLIEGPLTMLLEREGFPEKSTIEGVVRNSKSLKGLIDQILLLSEVDEKSLNLKASKLNIVQAVSEFSAQFASLFEQKGIRFRLNAQQPLIEAYVDYEKLQIIINNLLSNAIKFSQQSGQITIDISATAARGGAKDDYTRDEYVQIMVSDTGQGIPNRELAYVFDRYFQSDSSELSKSGFGTGIGLALVKELVDLHAGGVTVQSVYEQENSASQTGTSFCVTFPLGRAHLNDNEIVESSDVVTDAQESNVNISNLPPKAAHQHKPEDTLKKPQGEHATVLVVDDNEDMRRHIRRLLEGDYKVVTAQDGLVAEEVLNKHLPDIIVTDLMMPNRDGLEFVKSIKKNNEFVKIPVIMLTARAGLDDRIKGLIAAVDDYLVKPFNGRELKVRIKNLLTKQAQFHAFYQNEASEPQDKPNSKPKTYLDKVKAVVNRRLMEPDFGVEELAEALHVSEATLRRNLSDKANFTPAAFIRHCRLEKARHMSLQGEVRSISELAYAVGFSQPGYFSRLYKKTFNCEVDIQSKPRQQSPR